MNAGAHDRRPCTDPQTSDPDRTWRPLSRNRSKSIMLLPANGKESIPARLHKTLTLSDFLGERRNHASSSRSDTVDLLDLEKGVFT